MDEPFPSAMMQNIEHFFREVDPSLPSGYDLYHEVFDTNLFFPLQRKAELLGMIRRTRMVPGPKGSGPYTVMEIGADKGGGLYHWCKCFPTVKQVIACEVRGIPYAPHFEKAFLNKDFLWIPYSSHCPKSVEDVRRFLGKNSRIDVLFIDGDKGGMLEDFDAYLPLMDPQGVVFLHDINDGPSEGPRIAFETIRSRGYKTEEIIDTSDYHNLVKGLSSELDDLHLTPYENWLLHWHGRSCGVGVIWMSGGPINQGGYP